MREADIGKNWFEASQVKKFTRSLLKGKSWVWWGMPVIPAMAGNVK
jgi:hypothetical protein